MTDPQKLIESIKSGKFDQALSDIDKTIQMSHESVGLRYKLKLSMIREKNAVMNDNKFWADKLAKKDKKKAKNMFDEFLELHQKAFDKPFDNYDRKTREHHFENWKAMMMWDWVKIRKSLGLPVDKQTGGTTL